MNVLRLDALHDPARSCAVQISTAVRQGVRHA